ncbi:MAG: HlyU family transcriptional regulator [Paracoccaceae bacterium]
MSLLSRLFGGNKSQPEVTPEIYKDFRIFAEPVSESGGFRVSARIEKTIDGEVKTHQLIRADTLRSEEDAAAASVAKAKQIIDERGDAIF